MLSQRKREFRKRVRDALNNVDYGSVHLPARCITKGFIQQIPISLLTHQPQPLLFQTTNTFIQWLFDGGMDQQNTGAPRPEPFYTRMSLPYNPDNPVSYTKKGSSSTLSYTEESSIPSTHITDVVEASNVLYALNPDYKKSVLLYDNISGEEFVGWESGYGTVQPQWRSTAEHNSALNFVQESIRLSISFIAHTVLHASESILSAVPAAPRYEPRQLDDLTQCWALLLNIQTPDNNYATCLVPVQLDIKGGVPTHLKLRTPNIMPWDTPLSLIHASFAQKYVKFYTLAGIPNYDDIYAKIQDRPSLYCNDVEPFLPKEIHSQWTTEKRWIPRQYQTCWQFFPEGSCQFRRKNLVTIGGRPRTNIGSCRYSDLLLLTQAIIETSALSEITFNAGQSPPSKQFTCVHINDFEYVSSCSSRPSSTAITVVQQAAVHSIHSRIDLKQHLVNYSLSCGYHQLCTGIPTDGSVFRPVHHTAVARVFLWLQETDNSIAARKRHLLHGLSHVKNACN
jgi:hypothetical protein